MKITKLKLLSTAILVGTILPSAAVTLTLGGIDPSTAPPGSTDAAATNFTIIGKLVTTTGAEGFDVDLAASIFTYQSNSKATASASPFLAVQSGSIHESGSYDVIFIGTPLAKGAPGVDVSASLGTGTFSLPANSTIAAGYWSAASQSPVSVTTGTASGDTLIIGGFDVNINNDLTLTGTDYSTNTGVNNRLYHYQIDLAPIPEPRSSGLLLGLSGLAILLRRRR